MRLEHWWYTVPLRLRSLFRGAQVERELDEELRDHIERLTQQHISHGLTPEEARAAARRTMRGIEARKDDCRDARRFGVIDDLLRDLRYAARMLRRSPGFTAVAVLSLALGIGANTAVFSVIDGLMLRKLPVSEPERLVYFRQHFPPERTTDELPFPQFERLRDGTRSFSAFSTINVFDRSNITLSGRGGGLDPDRARVAIVPASYFRLFGVRPSIGRVFAAEEDRRWGAHPLVVISDAYWQRRLIRAGDVLGRTLTLNRTPFTIVGVMPPGFAGEWIGRPVDLWVPWTMHQQVLVEQPGPLTAPNDNWLHVFARLKPGVTIERARLDAQAVNQLALKDLAGPGATPAILQRLAQWRMDLEPAARGYSPQREKLTQPLIILTFVVGLVLLVACANVASLLLARGAQRQRELAVRLAIGAGAGRRTRQLLTEGVLLSVMGGTLGIVLAMWGAAALGTSVVAGPVDMFWGRSSWIAFDVRVDGRALLVTAGLCLVTGVLFGLAPSARTRLPLAPALTGRGGTNGVGPRFRAGKALVVAQVALSLMVAIAAGLLVRTLKNLEAQELGFRRDHVLFVWTQPSAIARDPLALREIWSRVHRRLSSLPGVIAASASNAGVLNGFMPVGVPLNDAMRVEGQPPAPQTSTPAGRSFIAPGFFATMGIPIIAGREFTERDSEPAPPVVIINESLARHHFGTQNPVGRRVGFGPAATGTPETVVGVVRDFEAGTPRAVGYKQFRTYYPYRDRESQRRLAVMMAAVRTAGDPRSTIALVRAELAKVEPDLPVLKIDTADEQLADVLAQDRLVAGLATFFGSLAVLLACLGLYGVIAYNTTGRTNEIGIRMALGATRGGVLSMVLQESVRLALGGIAIGVPATLVAARLISSRLFGVSASDPLTIACASAVMITVAALAGFLPARRAARTDPMEALRCD